MAATRKIMTYQELLADLEVNEYPFLHTGYPPSHTKYDSRFCSLGLTWEETKAHATNGWPEGETRIRELSAGFLETVKGSISGEHWMWDTEGAMYDVGEYLAGNPECWLTRAASDTNKVIRMVYNAGVSGGVSVATILTRGSLIAALVEALELVGKRVELWECIATGHGKTAFEMWVQVKASDQPLHLPTVAYALAHPAFVRRIMVWHGFMRFWDAPLDNSLGRPTPTEDKGDLYIGEALFGSMNWNDPATVKQWLLARLAEQGVTVL